MAKVNIGRHRVVVKPGNQTEHKMCKSIPGASWNKPLKEYSYPLYSLQTVLSVFFKLNTLEDVKEVVGTGSFPQKIHDILENSYMAESLTKLLKETGPGHMEDKGFLFRHQQLCREIANHNPRYGFFCEAGTGKTPIALQIIVDDIMASYADTSRGSKWLVVCPLSLIRNAWLEDCAKFFPSLKAVSLHGNTAARTRKAFAIANADVYIINFESFKVHYDKLVAMGFKGVIVDESSKMKNHKSEITKKLDEMSKLVDKFYELSGTPAPNSMLEYFPQIRAIDPSLLGTSFTNFKAKWFYPVNKGGFDVFEITEEKKLELVKMIEKRAIFIAKADCLDLPKRMPPVIRDVIMTPELKKTYNKMKHDLYCAIGDNLVITATTGVTSLGKLNQLTSGIIIDTENGAKVHRVSNVKLNALKELLEELGNQQVIIWANFREEFVMIKEVLGDNCTTYNGATGKAEMQPLMDKHYGEGAYEKYRDIGLSDKDMSNKLFVENKVQYMVANAASAGHGLTWTNSHTAVYYSLNYSYEQWAQSCDRIDRYTQTVSCSYYYLLMPGTIDHVIYKCLQNKGSLSKEVLNHLKAKSISGKDEENDF